MELRCYFKIIIRRGQIKEGEEPGCDSENLMNMLMLIISTLNGYYNILSVTHI